MTKKKFFMLPPFVIFSLGETLSINPNRFLSDPFDKTTLCFLSYREAVWQEIVKIYNL